MENIYKVGDKVRVDSDLSYFTTLGIDMVINEIVLERVDGVLVPFYRTNFPCPVHGNYNGFELVKLG
jgi:hypothetical protein